MLTILNIPNDIFLNSFIETAAMERVAAFYRIKNPRGDRKDIYFPNFELAQLETNLLYFLYVYLAYTPVDPMILNKENLLPLWNLFMKAIKVIYFDLKATTNFLYYFRYFNLLPIQIQ